MGDSNLKSLIQGPLSFRDDNLIVKYIISYNRDLNFAGLSFHVPENIKDCITAFLRHFLVG